MYLTCNNCNWEQEYWDEELNPFQHMLEWKKALLSEDITTPLKQGKTVRDLALEAIDLALTAIREVKYRNHEEFERLNPNHTCPQCRMAQTLRESEEYLVAAESRLSEEVIFLPGRLHESDHPATMEPGAWKYLDLSEGKPLEIIVNGQKKAMVGDRLSYDQVVRLTINKDSSALFTITYMRGPAANPEGSLLRGQTVEIAAGMIFCAVVTGYA